MEGQKPSWMRWGGVALGLIVAVMLGLGLKDLLVSDKPAKKPRLQQITLVKPPPPPPPEKKPPEPEIKKEEVKIEQPKPEEAPKPADNEPPAGKDLGVDADANGSGDGFGLVGRKGGRDLLAGVGGKYAGYSIPVAQQINEQISEYMRKHRLAFNYRIQVRIWIAKDGHVEKFELNGSTGSPDTDSSIKLALAGLSSVKERPPEDMPQPIKLRLTSRL
ncbi:TonB-dependent receptor [Sulfuricella denitrificans skB26]|uniref:TonB-dependent receptor n=1 Tax=Sulfuricella denitrificans (strain DSM 22764 / NBRC 105220 / skB26) TaxID=1163617 RepID=S6ABA7_SULDS|nr:TonB C-terminal domain-containing protein [Sulfuricella denitrificans]BAN36625.1 TonB-dependent receptor [Sulfuricella denitrificans skB26]